MAALGMSTSCEIPPLSSRCGSTGTRVKLPLPVSRATINLMRSAMLACVITATLTISSCNRVSEQPQAHAVPISPDVDEAVLPVAVKPVSYQPLPITVKGRGVLLPGDEREVSAPFSAEVASTRRTRR